MLFFCSFRETAANTAQGTTVPKPEITTVASLQEHEAQVWKGCCSAVPLLRSIATHKSWK